MAISMIHCSPDCPLAKREGVAAVFTIRAASVTCDLCRKYGYSHPPAVPARPADASPDLIKKFIVHHTRPNPNTMAAYALADASYMEAVLKKLRESFPTELE